MMGARLIKAGGPGGSGVAKALISGKDIQKIVDSEDCPSQPLIAGTSAKYFDILGWDPRGVNNTTPTLSCFPDSFTRQVWNLQTEADGMLGSSKSSLTTLWQRAKALAQGCSEALALSFNGTDEALGEHVNTTPGIADMVEIIERHAQWRDKESWKRGGEKLLYWGFSYGTLIGTTFAAIHPHRVGRLVLDGVVDAEDYYNINGNGNWTSNLYDSDLILERFFEYCAKAGPEKCSFYRLGGAVEMHREFDRILEILWESPLSVPSTPYRGPEVITWSDVKLMVKTAMYQPLWFFPRMADLLQDILVTNGSAFAEMKHSQRHCAGCKSTECESSGPYSRECMIPGWDGVDASSAILCSDGEGMGDFDRDEFVKYWSVLKNQSKVMGDYWAQTRLNCMSWRAKAKWRYPGPISANTSNPVLFISNTRDTVTAIRK